jgi:hypothetical protein
MAVALLEVDGVIPDTLFKEIAKLKGVRALKLLRF